MTSASTAICAVRLLRRTSRAATTGVIPTFSSNPPRRRKKPSAARRWKDARSKRSGTTAKAERDRTMTMNCPAKPTQRTVEPEAPTRASVPERFRRLKWNEMVWSCDFVADERLGLQPLEGPSGFRAGSFARPIYRREEIVRFRATSTKKPKQNNKTSMNPPTITAYLKPAWG